MLHIPPQYARYSETLTALAPIFLGLDGTVHVGTAPLTAYFVGVCCANTESEGIILTGGSSEVYIAPSQAHLNISRDALASTQTGTWGAEPGYERVAVSYTSNNKYYIGVSMATTVDLSSLEAADATNAANIASNVTDIGTNAASAATNATSITTNATNISTNLTSIGGNTTNIASNLSTLGAQAASIAAVESEADVLNTYVQSIDPDADLTSGYTFTVAEGIYTPGAWNAVPIKGTLVRLDASGNPFMADASTNNGEFFGVCTSDPSLDGGVWTFTVSTQQLVDLDIDFGLGSVYQGSVYLQNKTLTASIATAEDQYSTSAPGSGPQVSFEAFRRPFGTQASVMQLSQVTRVS